MLTNPVYIDYLKIIKLWNCPPGPDQAACAEKNKLRIINSFTNSIFKLRFLTHLSSARFFLLTSETVHPLADNKSKVTVNGVDVITNESISFDFIVPNNRLGDYTFLFNTLLNKSFKEESLNKRAFLLKSGDKFLLQINMPMSDSYKLMLLPGFGIINNYNAGEISTISNIPFPEIMVFEGMPGIPNWNPCARWDENLNRLPDDPNCKKSLNVREGIKALLTNQMEGQGDKKKSKSGLLMVALAIASYFLTGS